MMYGAGGGAAGLDGRAKCFIRFLSEECYRYQRDNSNPPKAPLGGVVDACQCRAPEHTALRPRYARSKEEF